MPVVRAALARGQAVQLAVRGSSMRPFFRDGGSVLLQPLNGAPRVGDVVLAECTSGGDHYVLHRVVRVETDGVYLRGDAQRDDEGPFPMATIVATVAPADAAQHAPLQTGILRLAGRAWARIGPRGRWMIRQVGGLLRVGLRTKAPPKSSSRTARIR